MAKSFCAQRRETARFIAHQFTLAQVGWLRLQAQLSTLPIVVYSAQYTQQEVQMSYVIGANSFVAKPQTVEQFAELFAAQFSLWFKHSPSAEMHAA